MDGTIAQRSTNNVHFVEESIPRFRNCTWSLRLHGLLRHAKTETDAPSNAALSFEDDAATSVVVLSATS